MRLPDDLPPMLATPIEAVRPDPHKWPAVTRQSLRPVGPVPVTPPEPEPQVTGRSTCPGLTAHIVSVLPSLSFRFLARDVLKHVPDDGRPENLRYKSVSDVLLKLVKSGKLESFRPNGRPCSGILVYQQKRSQSR